MSDKKIRVYNDRRYDIGVQLVNKQTINIKSGSFALLTEDDIAYIESICSYDKKLFGTGKLRIDKPEEKDLGDLGVYPVEQNQHLPTEEIEQRLHGKLADLKEWIASITDKSLLFEIREVAKGIDLPVSRMRVINDAMPESLSDDLNE